jgi:hypothetical protein
MTLPSGDCGLIFWFSFDTQVSFLFDPVGACVEMAGVGPAGFGVDLRGGFVRRKSQD